MFANESVPSGHTVSRLILDLHERAHELGYREFQRFAFERLGQVLAFDAGLMGIGTIRNGVPQGHDILLHQRPRAMMQSWEAVKHEDRVAIAAMNSPGRTVSFALASSELSGCSALVEHCKRWQIEHVLCTAQVDQGSGLYWVMSLFRSDPAHPFEEHERYAKELIVPHVFAAARQARLGRLRASSRVSEVHGQVAAVVSDDGMVLEAESGLVELLRAEDPNWVGPWLPADLWHTLRAMAPASYNGKRIVVRADAAEEVWLLHVRRTVVADQLTPRERQVAEAFSLGETYREIGAELGIAPNTVRRHLANIYEKLGISSKAELDRMLGNLH